MNQHPVVKKLRYLSRRVFRLIFSPMQRLGASGNAWYFSLFPLAYGREQLSVSEGIRTFRMRGKDWHGSSPVLRRNIHRIEKGLITEPRKDVFAESYIVETVEAYSYALKHGILESGELQWASAVLDMYFSEVADTAIVRAAKVEFEAAGYTGNGVTPYAAKARVMSNISPEQFHSLTLKRRSVRYYDNRPVPRDIIDQALESAVQAPSACNRQPFFFHVFDDPTEVAKVAAVPNGARGFASNYTGIIVLTGRFENFFDERDRHVPYIDASLAAMQFMLALETHGVSSCVINWADLPEKDRAIRSLLNMPAYESVIMMISYGYAREDGGIPSSAKKNLVEVRRYNFEK